MRSLFCGLGAEALVQSGKRASELLHLFDTVPQLLKNVRFAGGKPLDDAKVKAVIAESYERIHRSNLVGMGVLPLQFKPGETVELKPSSFHIMMMGLKQPIEKRKPFKGSLVFEKAGTVEIQYKVEPLGAKGPAGSAADRRTPAGRGRCCRAPRGPCCRRRRG